MAQSCLVANVMTRRFFALSPHTSTQTAARVMVAHHFTGAPVIDDDAEPVGVVSLADLANDSYVPLSDTFGFDNYYEVGAGTPWGLGTGKTIAGGRVRDVMSSQLSLISSDSTIGQAAELMLKLSVRRLLVIGGVRLCGILTALDVTRAMLELGSPRRKVSTGSCNGRRRNRPRVS